MESGDDDGLSPLALGIVVVTHNSTALLPDLIASLPAALEGVGAWQLSIADSGSTDGCPEAAEQLAPSARLVRLDGNRGFAAGINAGIALLDPADAYLVLNPDARLDAGSVARMLAALADSSVGIVVPRLRDDSGHLQLSLRREPTVGRALGEACVGGLRAGRAERWGETVVDPVRYDERQQVDWATGAVMLVSAAAMSAVGPWDESFFLYSEETDFCLRARDAGYATVFEPGATAVHVGGESGVSPHLYALLTANRVRLFRRRAGTARAGLFWLVIFLGELVRAVTGRRTSRAALATLITMPTPGPRP